MLIKTHICAALEGLNINVFLPLSETVTSICMLSRSGVGEFWLSWWEPLLLLVVISLLLAPFGDGERERDIDLECVEGDGVREPEISTQKSVRDHIQWNPL